MRILNIAEKPSVSKSITNILTSNSKKLTTKCKYTPVYQFSHPYENTQAEFIFTAVLGHLFHFEFSDKRKWNEFDPVELFHLPITKIENNNEIVQNIKFHSKNIDLIVIWTDCDREGENIAEEIKSLIDKKIKVRRARFFGISKNEILRALNELVEVNINESDAVNARSELDLRIGASFTRLQTLTLSINKNVISYGSCQSPTLGFVVDRAELVENFVPEKYFSLEIEHKGDIFKWIKNKNSCVKEAMSLSLVKENTFDKMDLDKTSACDTGNNFYLFDKNCTVLIHNLIKNKSAKVTRLTNTTVKKFKPLPLRTVELQKKLSKKISSFKLMEIAESLYNKGFISYPRTETDTFGKKFDFKNILKEIQDDYTNNFVFKYPRSGKNDDNAHLPIYPLKSGKNLTGFDKEVFDFIARRFLACCSEDAEGTETIIQLTIQVKNNLFVFEKKGLKIIKPGFLSIYPYDKWTESKFINQYHLNQILDKYELNLTESTTSPPTFLTESELINLMDKNGIGTDATIHEHIKKIQEREYCMKRGIYFVPSKLGCGLISGHRKILNDDGNGVSLVEPVLRRDLENKLKEIERGKPKNVILREQISIYESFYKKMKEKIEEFKTEVLNKMNGSEFKILNKKNNFSDDEGNFDKKSSVNQRKENRKSNDDITQISKKTKTFENVDEDENTNNLPKLSDTVMCKCRKNAKIFKVTKKSSKYKGKSFLCCGMFPKKCDFFAWEGDESSGNVFVENIKVNIKCKCGFEPKACVAYSEENNGKVYFKCKKSYKPCDYFSWKDD